MNQIEDKTLLLGFIMEKNYEKKNKKTYNKICM